MDWDTSTVPDPQDPQTFRNSKLDWSEVEQGGHAELLDLHRRLLALRRTYPDITDPRFEHSAVASDDDAGWLRIERGAFLMAVNFRAEATVVDLPGELELLLTVGDVGPPSESGASERTDHAQLRLGAHSALIARRIH